MRGRFGDLLSLSPIVQALESRLLLTGTPADVDLGFIGPVPQGESAQVSLTQGDDGIGNFVSTPTNRLIVFQLSAGLSDLTLQTSAVSDEAATAKGDLSVQVIRDINIDGELDGTELASPSLVQTIVRNTGQHVLVVSDLSTGVYFVRLAVTNFESDPGVQTADVAYDLLMTAADVAPPDIRVQFGAVQIADGDAVAGAGDGTDFGSAQVGGSPPLRTYTVTNVGGSALLLGAVGVTGNFELASGLPSTLGAGASTTFTVQMLTSAVGSQAGQISFVTNVSGKDTFDFAVAGNVSAAAVPDISVQFSATEIADGDASPSVLEGTDFGSVLVNAVTHPQHIFTIVNTGGAALTVGTVTVPSGFELVSSPAPSIAPGASTSFDVSFIATSAGTRTGDIQIATSVSGKNPYIFTVTGTVIATEAPTTDVAIAAIVPALPPTVVGGEKSAKGKVDVSISNSTPLTYRGKVTVVVYASTDDVVSPADDLTLGSASKSLKLKTQAGKVLKVKVKLPVPSADGDFNVLVQISGPGVDATSHAQGTVRLERPFVHLTATPGTLPAQVFTFGQKMRVDSTLSNTGNVTAKGKVQADLFISTDGTIDDPTKSFMIDPLKLKVSLKPGLPRNIALKLKLPTIFPAGFGPGAYQLVVRFTPLDALAVLAASQEQAGVSVPFTIG